MKISKKIMQVCLSIISIITIIFIILGLSYIIQIKVMNKKYANVIGYSLFEVLTGSMSPTIEIGDDVFVEITKDIKKGDIVIFDDEKRNDFIIHRVIDIQDNLIVTKGDNNNIQDSQMPKDRVIGKVLIIFPKMGKVQEFFRKPYIFIPLIDIIIISTLEVNFRKKSKKTNNLEK